jgi:NAD(P)-dependent dehydrogenase (short-subunit alcohol dehydrogenase family)
LLERQARVAFAVRDVSAPSLRELLARGPGSVALPVELADRAQTGTLVERACDALGGIDVLINCAGIVRYAALSELTPADLYEQFEVNCFAAMWIARAAALQLAAHGGGAIVNVASTLGLKPAPLTAAYAASKAALISFTRSLALEFAAQRVRVNAVAPGIVDTDMVRVARPVAPGSQAGPETDASPLSVEAQLAQLGALHPLGRMGTSAEVAQAVLYLLDAQFVTGTVLVADGGLLLT